MGELITVDWAGTFIPDKSLLEAILRGSVVYLGLFLLLRLVLRRQAGSLSLTDVLLITLLADASQNAMASEYKSVPVGLLLCAVLMFWNFALDWLAHRSKWFAKLVDPPPKPLVRDGRPVRETMAQEKITDEELQSQLRLNGVADVRQVKQAFLEPRGEISIIKDEGGPPPDRNGPSESANGRGEPLAEGEELDRFLAAAAALRRRLEWHRQQSAAHEEKIAAIKRALAAEGFPVKPLAPAGTRRGTTAGQPAS